MRTRSIGSLAVSVIGLGCNNFGWRIDQAHTREVVDAAIDAGITLFDTADIYGDTQAETFLGRALEGRRDRVVLATKFGKRGDPAITGGATARYVRDAIEGSLRRLGTDRIDLYQLHEPRPETPIEETMGVLDELVAEGKVREIGCSNFSATQLREAADAARGPGFVCVQNELNLLDRDDLDEGLAEAERSGMAYLPYFPLASGFLTGKYRRGEPVAAGSRLDTWFDAQERADVLTESRFDRLEALEAFASGHGRSLLELAFAWLLALPPVASVIAGATSPTQVMANAAAGEWALSPEELASVP
ncbi:MAG: aldo/keto reductase [Actinomycetota bacterium]|nr:aldo/keto reductase [Actinomycetota bacterium]